MNSWAAVGKYDCNFLCVCVVGGRDGLQLARQFSQSEKLTHCINAFVEDESEMPTFGQLGCQGFIVLDAKHRVVSPATSPYMQVRGLAFEHVEALLDALCQQKPLPAVCPGELLQLLEGPPDMPQVQGSRGICVKLQGDDVDFGFQTGPLQGKMLRVPLSKVKKLDGEEEETVASRGQGTCSSQGTCSTKGTCSTQGSCGSGGGQSIADKGPCSQGDCSGGAQGACSKGGGASANAVDAGASPSLDSAFVAAALNVASVKVPSMDAEHVQCAAALRRLAEESSRPALEQVLLCLTEHFGHEEALFEEFGFGVHKNEKLSAKVTHMKDHKRILDKIRQQLAAVAGGVPAEFVVEVLRDFHEHTSQYDSKYGDHLIEQGAH